MSRIRHIFLVMSLCLCIPVVVLAQPTVETVSPSAIENLDVDWQATGELVFLPLTQELEPGSHEAQIRIHDGDQPLFFERLGFTIGAAESRSANRSSKVGVSALQLLAYQPEERSWLLEALKGGADIGVEIRLGKEVVFKGSLTDVVATSDKLRDGLMVPVQATPKFADLRSEAPAFKVLCEEDCYDDYSDCQVDFCYWDYDEYMCNEGCDIELDECLEDAVPVCPTPTCTPGVISTSTSTALISSQYQGQSCMRDVYTFNSSVYYYRYALTYQVTTTELRRNADCSTTLVVTGVSTFSTTCNQRTSFTCNFGFLYPSCHF